MPRSRNPFPSYNFHKASGQATVRVYRPDGTDRLLYLGAYNSPASRAEYTRICGELLPGNIYVAQEDDITIAEMIVQFLDHAESYYRSETGKRSSEVRELQASLKPLHRLYGTTSASEFGPKALAVVRDSMVEAGWCRSVINNRVNRIRRCFKWATAQELVRPGVYEGLRALAGLKAGRTSAPESKAVEPVPAELFQTTLPHLPRMARVIVELLRWTGMRPGEGCRLRLCEVDQSGQVWVYRPAKHKTAYKGKMRAIPLGPKSQAALQSYLAEIGSIQPDAPVFCAARERERRYAEMRAKRKTRVQPSQKSRKKATSTRVPKGGYSPMALAHAVAAACKRGRIEHWHPNQLRHLFATEVRKLFGLEAAQVCLGHSHADITQTYAERDEAKAVDVASKIG